MLAQLWCFFPFFSSHVWKGHRDVRLAACAAGVLRSFLFLFFLHRGRRLRGDAAAPGQQAEGSQRRQAAGTSAASYRPCTATGAPLWRRARDCYQANYASHLRYAAPVEGVLNVVLNCSKLWFSGLLSSSLLRTFLSCFFCLSVCNATPNFCILFQYNCETHCAQRLWTQTAWLIGTTRAGWTLGAGMQSETQRWVAAAVSRANSIFSLILFGYLFFFCSDFFFLNQMIDCCFSPKLYK